ncbi:hypothetical protein GCM10011575_02010 [Microlunatus endophyticus]|uniref:Uncharacterized protein n=1 Tax=Microlunatus endophyticus TaxID=1716077 RepID=A0A917W0W9_9ACTN|nr:hypothetical protein GCM10011575_02010 [Microlunatus endophyticus]
MLTPGAIASEAACIAWAAIRPAIRIFSIVSALWTWDPVYGAGPSLSTYSGRGMAAGTARRDEIGYGLIGDATGSTQAILCALVS